jgi:hypothetical protein
LTLAADQLAGGRRPTDPSTMLSDALVSLHGPPGERPAVRDPDPKNPMRFTEGAISLLRRGHDLQRRFFRNRALGAKGVVAALLTTTADEEGIVTDVLPVRARFLAIARERLADQPAMVQKWTHALELEPAAAPRLNNDQPWSGQRVDHLDIARDAAAIANVAAGQNSSLPMAFGVFGDWGAGKTFFMRLIHEQIAALVVPKPPDDGFEHAIVQIQFNAWHYAETNLWASLVGHIFSELDRWMTRGSGETPKKADELLSRLSTSRQLALEAATDLMQRRKTHWKAGEVLATAQDALVLAQEAAARAPVVAWGAAVKAVRQAIQGDDELRNQLASARSALGLPELMEDKAKLAGVLNEINEAASAGNAALAALRATAASRATIILSIVMLILVPAALFAAKQVLAWVLGWGNFTDIGHGFESLGGLLAMASVLVGGFTGRVRAITDKFTVLRGQIDDEVRIATETEQQAVAASGKSLGAAAAEVEQARTVLRATGDQVAAALREYAEETAGPGIARFVRARAGDEGYARHLGLVSAIRRDFEQLEALMLSKGDPPEHLEAARRHYEARVEALIAEAGHGETLLTATEKDSLRETAKSLRDPNMPEQMAFRRIVLFIDDLDRCEADKVVEVLQAVNMLLTFRLFVVVVAVDARWLTRSLEKRYPDFFGVTNGGGKAGRATAADYLEKIFQVPYWVPRMTARASESLVGDLIAGDRIADAPASPAPPTPLPGPVTPAPGTIVPEPHVAGPAPEDEQPEDPPEDDKPTKMIALGLTAKEISALTSLSPFLGGSPRRAGRFVNLYRVAKASLSPAERRGLEASTYRALATQLAIATGAPNAFDSWVTACAAPDAQLESIPTRMGWPNGRNDESANLLGAVEWFRKDIDSTDALIQLQSQAPRAARFSFVVPKKDAAQGETL